MCRGHQLAGTPDLSWRGCAFIGATKNGVLGVEVIVLFAQSRAMKNELALQTWRPSVGNNALPLGSGIAAEA
jgi:hypothetical protein